MLVVPRIRCQLKFVHRDALHLAMRWLVDYARSRGEKSMPQRLAGELIDAVQGKGGAVKKA